MNRIRKKMGVLLYILICGAAVTLKAQNTFPSTGNVGIGTSSPAYLLDVRGLSSFSQQIYSTKGYGLTKSSSSTDTINGCPWYGMGIVYSGAFGGAHVVQMAGYYGLYFKTALGQVLLTQNGNVGIGTISPTQKLSVDGNINAKEVIVTTSGWPDYVFNKGYRLPSLSALSEQIKTEGHLPDMPSAQEVEANGQSLGDMNKKLLQKVEELTLYIIQQDKALSEQRQRNDTAEEKLNKQQAEIEALKAQNRQILSLIQKNR